MNAIQLLRHHEHDNFFQGGGYGGGYGHGGGHGGGTACIVKGSYCQCHYCKCEKGHVSCKGYGHEKGYGEEKMVMLNAVQ